MKPTTITFKKCALTALATFMISACGSGGSISNRADQTQPSQPQASKPQASKPQAAQPQAPQVAQPQAPQAPQAAQPQAPQAPQAAQPQAPQAPQPPQPQAPQSPQAAQPQTPQAPQASQPQAPQPQAPQVAQPQAPQAPQPPQVAQPQAPQSPQAAQPQTPQSPQAAQPQAQQPPQPPQAVQPPLPVQPAPSQPQPQSPSTPPNTPETGSVLVYSKPKSQYGISKLDSYNTGIITVDGVGIIISLPHYKGNDWLRQGLVVNGDNRKLKVCCGKYSDIRFGVNTSLDVDDEYLFYNGNPTANMPTSGTATYTGEAVMATSSVGAFGQEPYPLGRSHFDVDFGNKTLAGYLSIPAIIPNEPNVEMEINAQISGNKFNGTTTSTEPAISDGRVEGKFYGDNASEMAGLAEGKGKGGSWGAAFGAAKQ